MKDAAEAPPSELDQCTGVGRKRKRSVSDDNDDDTDANAGCPMDVEGLAENASGNDARAERSARRWVEINELKEHAQELHDECKEIASNLKSFTQEVTRRGTQLGISRAEIVARWSNCLKEKKEDPKMDQTL